MTLMQPTPQSRWGTPDAHGRDPVFACEKQWRAPRRAALRHKRGDGVLSILVDRRLIVDEARDVMDRVGRLRFDDDDPTARTDDLHRLLQRSEPVLRVAEAIAENRDVEGVVGQSGGFAAAFHEARANRLAGAFKRLSVGLDPRDTRAERDEHGRHATAAAADIDRIKAGEVAKRSGERLMNGEIGPVF